MTRGSFDVQLEALHMNLLRMGSIVEKQIYQCIDSLVKQDVVLAEQVIKNDDLVDNLQREIEDMCIRLIATQQPMALDLRKIFTTTKIVTDLERMADHAVDIAKITKRLVGEKYIKELIDIPIMADIVREMIKESVDAYIANDVKKAYEICKKDDEIDKIYNRVFSELLTIMTQDPTTVNQASQFLFICKFLERVADHTTILCEWTIYKVTGEQKDLNE